MNEITALDALQSVLEASQEEAVLVFKHSTTCPVSASAYRRVDAWLEAAGDRAPQVFLVKVIESRPLSNAFAETLGVQHQSPQLILIRNGVGVWDASHGNITAEAIEAAL